MNVIITALICIRLFYLSRKVGSALGHDNAKLYIGAAAIMIESAAPYSAMGILFLPFYAKGNNVVVAMGQVWSKLTVRVSISCVFASVPTLKSPRSAFARK